MSWDTPNPDLVDFVRQQQSTAIDTYKINPTLLLEHVAQEDSFRDGGYGTRQVSELLQNAADALTESGVAGTVEFRIADGALYCANDGAAFTEAGVRAICYAFLSSKRDENSIGRFGLGFKSVLGISNNPQVFSQSASFQFNGEGTATLFETIPTASERLPLLRVPTQIDVAAERRADENLDDLMSWATTVIKLPLFAEGARVRRELEAFKSESLLFMASVSVLRVRLESGEELLNAEHRRSGDPSLGEVSISKPSGTSERWMFASREYTPSAAVLAELSATHARKSMTISYAVQAGASPTALGELWAWFPLQDMTTARGIFNAPWQVNDDRTTLIPTSRLNGEMLDVSAQLFLDVAARFSTPDDPAAHLDLFPARGDEARSHADRVLSDRIPTLARERAFIPDVTGALRAPTHFEGIPDFNHRVPADLVAIWTAAIGRTNFPHPTAFALGKNRNTRTRSLVRRVEARPAANQPMSPEVTIQEWLEELAKVGTRDAIAVALEIAGRLIEDGFSDAKTARIVPVERGAMASIAERDSVLIPRDGEPVPDSVSLVGSMAANDPEIRLALRKLGFHEVSLDQMLLALASQGSTKWEDDDWFKFWAALKSASPHAASESLTTLRNRRVAPQVLTRSGRWRLAAEVIADPSFAPDLLARHADSTVHGHRLDLLREAGCFTEPSPDFRVSSEAIFDDYKAAVRERVGKDLDHATVAIPDMTASGPLQMFIELADDQRSLASWTRATVTNSPSRTATVRVISRQKPGGENTHVFSPDIWAAMTHGIALTTLGFVPPSVAVGTSLKAFSELLPVLTDGIFSMALEAPGDLERVSDRTLASFLARDGYELGEAHLLTAVLAEASSRARFRGEQSIPAMSRGSVVRSARAEVVWVSAVEDIPILDEHGVPYLTGGLPADSTFVDDWGLTDSGVALSRSIEVRQDGVEVVLTDRFPSIGQMTSIPIAKVGLRTSSAITSRTTSPTGLIEKRLMSTRVDDTVIVDDSLDDLGVVLEVSKRLNLNLTRSDAESILRRDEQMRRSDLVESAVSAASDAKRLLTLVGTLALKNALPKGLLQAIESELGSQTDIEIAELFLKIRGFDSVRHLRNELRSKGLRVPTKWAEGTPEVQAFVLSLGFPTAYAGEKSLKKPQLQQVQGLVELKPLHPFQEELATKVRSLALAELGSSDPNRGLLYLPTGAGKTRVTVEAIARMFRDGELQGPVLWIAQSQELCEQAVEAFAEVWRAIGDERVMDICRFWGDYELDESEDELQVVVAIDDKLTSRIESSAATSYEWLSQPSLVVIDEAHTALSSSYTKILRWLGLTAARTDRPLLGLTATPYRGRNADINHRFVERFGNNRLESLDRDDPIGQLRREKVLSEVEHEVLDGIHVEARGSDYSTFAKMREVTKTMLDEIGQDLGRMQTVVDDIMGRPSDWQILVFAASVSSAHTIAALLTAKGKSVAAVDGSTRSQERRRIIGQFKTGEIQILVNCDLLTQGFDAPQVRALYIARPTFSPNRYHQMIGRGLRGPKNGGTETCLIVNMRDTFEEFGEDLAYTEFEYLWEKR